MVPLVPVVLLVPANLPADLTAWKKCGVDISIGGIRFEGRDKSIEIAGFYVLPRDSNHASGDPRSGSLLQEKSSGTSEFPQGHRYLYRKTP